VMPPGRSRRRSRPGENALPKPASPNRAPPAGDPLKVYHDREANENSARAIEGLRPGSPKRRSADNSDPAPAPLLADELHYLPKPARGGRNRPRSAKRASGTARHRERPVNAEIDDLKTSW